MKAYICDRCEETYTINDIFPTQGRIKGNFLAKIALLDRGGNFDASLDLCDDCLSDLFEFMNNNTVSSRGKTVGV